MKRLTYLVLLAFMVSPAACKKAAEETKQETIRITCWEGYAKDFVADFSKLVKEKHKVDVEVKIYNPTDQDEFYMAAKDGTADLISPPQDLAKTTRFDCFRGGKRAALRGGREQHPEHEAHFAVLPGRSIPDPRGQTLRCPIQLRTLRAGLQHGGGERGARQLECALGSSVHRASTRSTTTSRSATSGSQRSALGYTYDQIFDINKLDRAKIQERLDVLAKNAKSLWDGAANPDEFPELALATTWGFAAQQANLKGGKWLIASPRRGGPPGSTTGASPTPRRGRSRGFARSGSTSSFPRPSRPRS